MSIAIERVAAPTREAAALIAELDAVLGAVYAPQQRHGLSLDQVFESHVRFFIARIGGEAVGCGAVALFADYAEVKRMYTHEAVRGRGVARALLARLAAEARAAGRKVLRLETGTEQTAAIRLYESFGFHTCTAFGLYAALPAHRISASLFYEMPL